MISNPSVTSLLAVLTVTCATVPMTARAQQQPPQQPQPVTEQVIQPQVERRDVPLPRFPSKDIEFSLFAGTYATENFGASAVGGLRAGYHISEDVFMQFTLAQTRVSDENFRQILPGGLFTDPKEKLSYYSFSAGYNVLPGEVFIGSQHAKATAIYLAAGVGSTHFLEQRRHTFNLGLGVRLMLADRWSMQVDMRDHIYSLDLLGRRQTTQNLELTSGLSYYF
jgi:outer membrane beta-barrel protein